MHVADIQGQGDELNSVTEIIDRKSKIAVAKC
jgi:hypothetical protein